MALEIERKFLVDKEKLTFTQQGLTIRQGYFSTEGEATLRVRTKGEKGYLTIKGPTKGLTRIEYEYEIPYEDANNILDELCDKPLIEKTRYEIPFGKHVFEVDIFYGDNDGLCIAEVELQTEDEHVELPMWLGEEVSNQARYYNVNLLKSPYCSW